MTVRYGDI